MTAGTEPADTATGPKLRERILGAAFAAFMEHGYAGTSTLDIATRAHVSKRDIYSNFPSKQAMLAACIAARAARMRLPLQLPAPHDQRGLVAILTRFGATLLRETSRPEVLAVYRLAVGEAERSPDVAQTLETVGRAATHKALAVMLAEAQRSALLGAGVVAEMIDAFLGILWGGSLLVRLLLRTASAPSPKQCERRAATAAAALVRLYPPT